MTNSCFCYIRGNIREEYEFTVLLLLSGLLNIFPQNNKGKRVMWNITYKYCENIFINKPNHTMFDSPYPTTEGLG